MSKGSKPDRCEDFRRHALAVHEWVTTGGDPALLDFYDRIAFATFFFELRRASECPTAETEGATSA